MHDAPTPSTGTSATVSDDTCAPSASASYTSGRAPDHPKFAPRPAPHRRHPQHPQPAPPQAPKTPSPQESSPQPHLMITDGSPASPPTTDQSQTSGATRLLGLLTGCGEAPKSVDSRPGWARVIGKAAWREEVLSAGAQASNAAPHPLHPLRHINLPLRQRRFD